jgi:hypothetical protein
MEKKDVIMPRMVVMQPTVVNVSNPIANVSADGVDEGFNLSLAEDVQNEIVSDSALKRGVLRSKLEKMEKKRGFDKEGYKISWPMNRFELQLRYKAETSNSAETTMVFAHVGKWGDVICTDSLNEVSMKMIEKKGYFEQGDPDYTEWLENELMKLL